MLAAERPDLVEQVRDARQTHRRNEPARHWRLEEQIIQAGHQREQYEGPEHTPENEVHCLLPFSLQLTRIAPTQLNPYHFHALLLQLLCPGVDTV